ncbi:MAG: c-type cytochrome domain-containing protein, partial [Blastocatellia bacterium]
MAHSLFALATLILGTLLSCAAYAQDVPAYAQVDAILQNKCVVCHGHTTRRGGLNLETYAALLNGGKRGAPLVAGKSVDSLLVKFIDGRMQPRMPLGDELDAKDIQTIRAWIDAGAKGPPDAAMSNGEAARPEPAAKTLLPDIKPSRPVKAAISALAIQPGGALIALGVYRGVELLDARGAAVGNLDGLAGQARSVVFSPDGRWLAAAGGDPGQ